MTHSAAIVGKGGVGKTFVAAHLAMALSYLGVKTLVVGCDQKQDTVRALGAGLAPSLMEALERCQDDPGRFDFSQVVVRVSDYVDALELGPSRLLVGDYGAVYESAFRVFDRHHLLPLYDQVLYDVTEERFDASHLPLLRRIRFAIGVTDETLESLFVLNRVLRAVLIGGYEFELPVRPLGVVNNRSHTPGVFERYAGRTRCYPLLTVPGTPELAELRARGRTLFAEPQLPPALDRLIDGFLRIAGLLQAEVLQLTPVLPLPDEEVWKLGAEGVKSN